VVPAAVVMMGEAYCDSPGSQSVWMCQSRKHSDVLHVLTLIPALLGHMFVVGYSREGRTVVAGVQHMTARMAEDGRMGMDLDSTWVGKGFVHTVMQYSAKRDVAAVVLDP
jgi:hypothetical protein